MRICTFMLSPSTKEFLKGTKVVLQKFRKTKMLRFENGNLLPKLFWPTVRKKCSSDQKKLLKFEAEGWEFANFLRLLAQFIQLGKVWTIFGDRIFFQLIPGGFSYLIS